MLLYYTVDKQFTQRRLHERKTSPGTGQSAQLVLLILLLPRAGWDSIWSSAVSYSPFASKISPLRHSNVL